MAIEKLYKFNEIKSIFTPTTEDKKSGLIKKDIPTLIVCETCNDVSCCKF